MAARPASTPRRASRGGPPPAYELGRLPGVGPRFAAVRAASARFLSETYLDTAPDDELRAALVRFYEAVVDPPLHAEAVRRKAGFLRHALAYLEPNNTE